MPDDKPNPAFGAALGKYLSARSVTQTELAERTGKSMAYVSRTMAGTRYASAEWAETVAQALELKPKEIQELHTAAAIAAGFKLDLTKKSP